MEGLVFFLVGVVVLVLWIMACVNIGIIAHNSGRIARVLEDIHRTQPSPPQTGATPFSKAPPIPSRVP